MRPDVVLLKDMADAVYAADLFQVGLDEETFTRVDLVRSAVMYKLIIVGEAAGRLSTELQDAHPEVPWQKVVSFRNRATHGYFAVDWSIVYEIITVDAPRLRSQLLDIISQIEEESS